MNKLKKIIRRNLLVLFLLPISFMVEAKNCSLCKALATNDFKKIEQIIKHKLLDWKYGDEINNGSTVYVSYNKVYDELVAWLMEKECVELAAWDKCQAKILPYPSYAVVGAIFKTANKSKEITFHIREGHAGRFKNWINSRQRLYYLRMEESNGFVKKQIARCKIEIDNKALIDSLHNVDLNKQEPTSPSIAHSFDDTIAYKKLLGQYVNKDYSNDTITFAEYGNSPILVYMIKGEVNSVVRYAFRIVSEGMIKQIGTYSPWRIEIAGINLLENGELEVYFSGTYSFEENATIKHTYRKLD